MAEISPAPKFASSIPLEIGFHGASQKVCELGFRNLIREPDRAIIDALGHVVQISVGFLKLALRRALKFGDPRHVGRLKRSASFFV